MTVRKQEISGSQQKKELRATGQRKKDPEIPLNAKASK